MKKRIYNQENFNVSKWSGGTTSQYAIYPESAVYIDRDFVWRLSSATVETAESVFTKLPDYDRVLMVLEGEAVLAFGDERTAKLAAGQQESFDGGIKTKCFGKIRDYNLMVRKGCSGRLAIVEPSSQAFSIENGDAKGHTHSSYGFFCDSGYAVVSAGGETIMVSEGSQLVLDFLPEDDKAITIMGEGKTIIAEVFFTKQALVAEEIPEEKATFEDFKTAFMLSLTRNKWMQAINRKNSGVWHDEALSRRLAFFEKTYLGIIVCTVVSLVFAMLAVNGMNHTIALVAIVIWIIAYAFLISPLIYLIVLPKPIKAHMKDVKDLTEYELQLYEKELGKNVTTDKLLKKYKHSGLDNFDENYESVFSKISKRS